MLNLDFKKKNLKSQIFINFLFPSGHTFTSTKKYQFCEPPTTSAKIENTSIVYKQQDPQTRGKCRGPTKIAQLQRFTYLLFIF